MKTNRTRNRMRLALLTACCTVSGAWALSPAELQSLLDSGEKVTLVDIRLETLYQAGHIPNAINVPQRVLARKNLPELGRVVVYGRGLGTEDVDAAVQLLNAKPGIQAEALAGGYAAWKTARGTTTQQAGFQPEQLDYISYQDLSSGNAPDLVLVDLRQPATPKEGQLTRQGDAVAPDPLTSLTDKFPGRRVVHSPFEVVAVADRNSDGLQRQSANLQPVPVMVLIDSGDGAAEKTARMLRANGIYQVVILAGGEEILKRDGAAGLRRMGMGSKTVEGSHE